MIPKIIHQIWLGTKPIPGLHLGYMNGWIRNHPGWSYILWTEELIGSLLNPIYPEVYSNSITWIERHDLLRFDILYQYGGVYADCDVESIKCIEPLLGDTDIFISRWADEGHGGHPNGALNGATMGCSRHNHIMKGLIDKIPEAQKKFQPTTPNPGAFGTFYSADIAGPYFLDREALPDPNIYKPSLVYLSPLLDVGDFSQAYAIHHWSGFWNTGTFGDPTIKDNIKF